MMRALMFLVGMGAGSLWAQDARDALVAHAFREFDPTIRQQLLLTALNPALRPLRGAWPAGVQLLAQTLIEDRKDSTAAVWLRWAIRLSPDLQPDTVLFLPEVIAAYRSASDFVTRTRGAADSVVVTTWLWPTQTNGEQSGRLQIVASGLMSAAAVAVRGVGSIGAGPGIPLDPGSYQISAAVPGYDTVWVTREVLPAVTTVLEFPLSAAVAQVAAGRPPPVPQGRNKKRKGFPVLWVGLAAAGAAAAVVLFATGTTEQPAQTGGIVVTFPNP